MAFSFMSICAPRCGWLGCDGVTVQVLARSPTSTTEMRRYAHIEGLVDGIDMDTDHGQD